MQSRTERLYGFLILLKETNRGNHGFLNKDIENSVDGLLMEIKLGKIPSLYKVALLCESIKAHKQKDPFLDFAYLILNLYRERAAVQSGEKALTPAKPSEMPPNL